MSYNLSFISDKDLLAHVTETVKKYRFKISLNDLNKNLIDPVKLTFDSIVYHGKADNTALEEVLNNEAIRQIDKSNTNHIGYFHQDIFRYIGKDQGWKVPKKGYDVENDKLNIFVEMKNKHNTMNSSSSAKTYMRMQNTILHNPDATCYLAEVIASNSQNIEWECSLDQQKVSHPKIRRISIDKFYALVTGEEDAFAQLCGILPKVITDAVNKNARQFIKNTVLEDLQIQHAESILQRLYLLAFNEYQGFSHFQLYD